MSVLEVRDASFAYGRHEIFGGVSLTLERGQILSVIGPNGSGKSTLLNCLAGLLRLNTGEIVLEGRPQRSMRARDIARVVGYVPQNPASVYGYTVRDFVVMGRAPHIGILAKPGRRDYAMADAAIDAMGIAHLAGSPCTEISGGERQQASIARVMVQRPKVVMMDEPTSALDFGNQMRVIGMIRRLASEGYAVIMTTHTPDHAIMLDDTVALLDRSGALRVGVTDAILREDLLSAVYRTDVRMVYVKEVGRMACLASNPDFVPAVSAGCGRPIS